MWYTVVIPICGVEEFLYLAATKALNHIVLDKILFLDLETTENGKIKDIGALVGKTEIHESTITKLSDLIAESNIICGHNILNHDIPILAKKLGRSAFNGKIFIDTLLWSPILFANKPYHRLVKGYKLINENEVSNPLSDCKLTKELLIDEMRCFNDLDTELKNVFHSLLSNDNRFNAFLTLFNHTDAAVNISKSIHRLLGGKFCQSINIESIIQNDPIPLAYALAILTTSDTDSVCSSWLLNTEPKAQEIVNSLKFNNCNAKNCRYCSEALSPQKALLKYFGYPDFRKFDYDEETSLQERTVQAGLQNQSFVAVFPTGGGKSLTYQLPALMKGALNRQLTVVISPLVSLMKDQVDVLEARFGIQKAVAINGLLSPLERKEAIEHVESGFAHIVYLSPESLRSPTITRLLKSRSIARFVIDEAHCFSSWGQDFRVDYLFIGDFIKQLQDTNIRSPKIPVSCFTATAKPQVLEDVKSYFNERLRIDLKEYVTRANRKNLKYDVINVDDSRNKGIELLKVLSYSQFPAIIYCSRTKKVEEVNSLLIANDFRSTLFHGKLDKDVKIVNQNMFMNSEVDIIVATSAFGMGVDKDNVKTVIHHDISSSLENYIQEAGRAGRKSDIEANCYILYHEDDLDKHFSLLQQTKINKKEIQQVWGAIKATAKYREKISQSALQLAKKAGWDTEIRDLQNKVATSISALEDQGFLKRSQNSPRVFASSLLVKNLSGAISKVNSSDVLTENQKQRCSRVLQRLIKDEECRVDFLADVLDLTMSQIMETISNLRQIGVLGDKRDLTAFINKKRSNNSSRSTLARFLVVEKELLTLFLQDKSQYIPRALNQRLIDKGITASSADVIKSILNYWDKNNFISKSRIDRNKDLYEIVFKSKADLQSDIERRHEVASSCFGYLEKEQLKQKKDEENTQELPVEFSLIGMIKKVSPFLTLKEKPTILFEKALLFLNHIKAIQLEGGFMVIYNKLNLSNIDKSKKRFTRDDYLKLKDHYDHRIQQIHMVGEYAKKRISSYNAALVFVNEYFTLPFTEFTSKYFNRRSAEISRPITKEKFDKLIGALNTEQTSVLNSKDKNILVLAGPGSGKTKVLVHKIASLLILEDIKPEQFLMLTFSKAASMEFRSRVYKLVPEYGSLIKISTFHGYCFELLGQLGDIKKSENVISDCISAIKNEEIDITSIENKSVLLIDEFQDVNKEEWELIRLIAEKSGNIRIIGVGDDDQNIYAFRGASIVYMNLFSSEYNASIYDLSINYRSTQEIVSFSGKLASTLNSRLKAGIMLTSNVKSSGSITLNKYTSNHFFEPFIDSLKAEKLIGSSAVLTKTNFEALMIATLLKKQNIKAKIVGGAEGFRLGNLRELRIFTNYLKSVSAENGIVFPRFWLDSKSTFEANTSQSIHFETCLDVIELFENNTKAPFAFAEWLDYINQINISDAVRNDPETILVTTLHKSKGKEFDNVFVFMNDYKINTDESKRLLYVGFTRAKTFLSIHTNSNYFDHYEFTQEHQFSQQTTLPKTLELISTLKDINLSSIKFSPSQRVVQDLISGIALFPETQKFENYEVLGLSKYSGRKPFFTFSQHFIQETHSKYEKNGFVLESATLEYNVYWYCEETNQEYLVPLPRLVYIKKTKFKNETTNS